MGYFPYDFKGKGEGERGVRFLKERESGERFGEKGLSKNVKECQRMLYY